MTAAFDGHRHDLPCASPDCQAVLKGAYLGPLRVRELARIPFSEGWVLDERFERQDAYCPKHWAEPLDKEDPPTCSRSACPSRFTDRHPPFIHQDSGLPYCVSCARKINEAAGRELCRRES